MTNKVGRSACTQADPVATMLGYSDLPKDV